MSQITVTKQDTSRVSQNATRVSQDTNRVSQDTTKAQNASLKRPNTRRVKFNPILDTKVFVNDALFERSIDFTEYRVKLYVDVNEKPAEDYLLIHNNNYLVHTRHNQEIGENAPIKIYDIPNYTIRDIINFARNENIKNDHHKITVLNKLLNEIIDPDSKSVECLFKVTKEKLINPCENYAKFILYRRMGYTGTEMFYMRDMTLYTVYPRAISYPDPEMNLGSSYSLNIFGQYHGLLHIYSRTDNFFIEALMNQSKISSMIIQDYNRTIILGQKGEKTSNVLHRGKRYSILSCYVCGKTPCLVTELSNGIIIRWTGQAIT